jgi:penicillin amidase
VRRLRRILAALGSLAAAAALALGILVHRQLPPGLPPVLAGLSEPVRVDLDDRGVPTIRAANLRDAFRVQGYFAARERLFQMEVLRRMAQGRLAELFGASALPLDRIHRTYGFAGVARAAFQRLPRDEREDLEAYAGGVNAFIRERPGRWGLEFQLLGTVPDPWTPEDSLEGLLILNEDLSASWRQELRTSALAGLPAAVRRFLQPSVSARDLLVVPDAAPAPAPDAFAAFPPGEGARAALEGLPPEAGDRPEDVGSNNWVVAGWRSRSGMPILANDPHLGLDEPSIWLPVRIACQGRWWQGAALPFAPGIIIGESDRIAWGFTNLGTDVQDLYREPPVRERTELLRIRGGGTETFRVAEGRHGPQVARGLSLRWTALDPDLVRLPARRILEARDWAGFNLAMDAFPGPAQNAVYADRDGHIGWRATGLVPLRAPGEDGSRILDGGDPRNDWRGFVPLNEMPRVLDPPQGFIATANQRTIGTSFPHPVATRWAQPWRARRIAELIQAGGRLDRDAMERIQLDVVSREHQGFLDAAAPFLDPADRERFRGWDGAATRESTRFTEADRFLTAFQERLLEELTRDRVTEARWAFRGLDAETALRAPQDAWDALGLGPKGDLVRAAWVQAHASRPGPWGPSNPLAMHHPLGRGGRLLSWIFDPPQGLPQAGHRHTVRVADAAFGQSLRLVADLGDPEAATLVIATGESGHLGSSHRMDQMKAWREGDPGGKATRMSRPAKASFLLLPR